MAFNDISSVLYKIGSNWKSTDILKFEELVFLFVNIFNFYQRWHYELKRIVIFIICLSIFFFWLSKSKCKRWTWPYLAISVLFSFVGFIKTKILRLSINLTLLLALKLFSFMPCFAIRHTPNIATSTTALCLRWKIMAFRIRWCNQQ